MEIRAVDVGVVVDVDVADEKIESTEKQNDSSPSKGAQLIRACPLS